MNKEQLLNSIVDENTTIFRTSSVKGNIDITTNGYWYNDKSLYNEIKKISEQHIYTLDKLIETQTRIEKTIEYIKENGYIDLNGYDLLKILNGVDEE